jgi:spherulation-specific family 4 protein
MNLLEDSPRRKLYISASAIMLLTLSIVTVSISRQTYAASTVHSGVAIPLYSYPDSTWTTIAQTAKANPNVPILAIINPNSGPGSSSDPTYVTSVQSLQSAGVTVLGYVATGYATSSYSSTSNIESQVNQYNAWYHVNGIFFDEMSNTQGYESYYSTLNSYVKSNGMTYTMGNPGTSVPTSYIGVLDNLVIYENPGYPSLSFITYTGYPESDFGLIAYGVSYDGSFVTGAAPLVSYMYIDNISGANPYSALSSLFSQTVATLAATNSQTSSSTTSATSTTSVTTSTASVTTTTSVTTTSSTSTATSSTSAATGTSKLTVASRNTAGAAITGYWNVLYDQTGATRASGYTPIAYTLNNGQSYTVEADNYGSCNFAYWQDNGRTIYGSLRSIAITVDTNIVAVYNCGTTTTTTTTSSTSTASRTTTTATATPITIKVVSVNQAGVQFTGMYTTVQSATGKILAHGYTTLYFKGLSGASYTVCVSNYQTTIFSHWSTGSTNPCQTVRPTSNLVMTAYYG